MVQKTRPSEAKARLTRDDWLIAGLSALAQAGPNAVRVDTLADRLGATKGSFYWHFKDVGDFTRAMAGHWQAGAQAVLAAAEDAPAAARLRALLQVFATPPGPDPEPALRAMAHTDPAVSGTVQAVDAARLDRLTTLLSTCGVTNPDLAHALYAAALGMADLSTRTPRDNGDAIGTLVDLVLALR